MQMPVANRSPITANDAGSNARIRMFAPAAVRAEAMKNRRGSKRSARLNKALMMVPTTNPACTELVNRDAISGGRPTLSRKAGTTAEAENHSAIVATVQKAMIPSERARTDNNPHFAASGAGTKILERFEAHRPINAPCRRSTKDPS